MIFLNILNLDLIFAFMIKKIREWTISIDKNKRKKTNVYTTNINNFKEFSINNFMDENVKIDVPTLILNYLDHDDKKSLNILKEYYKTDFLIGMSPKCECFWYIEYHISNTLSDLNDIITDAERYKIGMDKLKNNLMKILFGGLKKLLELVVCIQLIHSTMKKV